MKTMQPALGLWMFWDAKLNAAVAGYGRVSAVRTVVAATGQGVSLREVDL